jgi:hypothetical protein
LSYSKSRPNLYLDQACRRLTAGDKITGATSKISGTSKITGATRGACPTKT